MAQRLVTGLAVLGFLTWSLLGLGAWGVVALGGDVLRFVAQGLFAADSEAAAIANAATHALQSLGSWLIISTWLFGSVAIFVGASLFRRLSTVEVHSVRFDWQETRQPREMKDVTPPREAPRGPTIHLPPPGARD